MSTQTAAESYRRQQEELERQRREEEVLERLKDHDFIRVLYEMLCMGAKK